MQETPNLVGSGFVAACPVGFQTVFIVFDEQFGIAPIAIGLIVKIFGFDLFERGDEVYDVSGAKFDEAIDVDPAYNPVKTCPSSGGIKPAGFP
jgi:hypothetical protein